MAAFRYHLGQAARALGASPYGSAVAALTMAVALFLASVTWVAARAVESMLEATAAKARITVFVRPEVKATAALAQEAARMAGPGAAAVLVPPDVALTRLKADLGSTGRALDDLATNPLPSSIEVRLSPATIAHEGLAAVHRAATRLRKLPFASDVDDGESFIAAVEAALEATKATGEALFGAALLIALFFIGAVARLSLVARRDEIEILRLVGATDRFIAAPFVLEGVFQGLAGGVLAAVLVALLERFVVPEALSLVGFARDIAVAPLGPGWLLVLVAGGAALGALASALSVQGFMRKAA